MAPAVAAVRHSVRACVRVHVRARALVRCVPATAESRWETSQWKALPLSLLFTDRLLILHTTHTLSVVPCGLQLYRPKSSYNMNGKD